MHRQPFLLGGAISESGPSTLAEDPHSERVCLVIAEAGVSADDLRPHLGTSLPLHITRWENRDYVAAIRNLRPRVIVVAARDGELAANSAALLAVLVRQFGVTVASLYG